MKLVVQDGLDTLLLGSALTMAWMSGQYPVVNGWLTAKLCGLLAYAYIVSVALTRNVLVVSL